MRYGCTPGRAETLVVRARDRVAGLQPALHDARDVGGVAVQRLAAVVGRRRALVGDARRAVRPGHDRPAALRRRALRHGDRARNGDGLAVDADGAIEDQRVAPAGDRGGARQRLGADDAAVTRAGQMARRRVEARRRGGAGRCGQQGEQGESDQESEGAHGSVRRRTLGPLGMEKVRARFFCLQDSGSPNFGSKGPRSEGQAVPAGGGVSLTRYRR